MIGALDIYGCHDSSRKLYFVLRVQIRLRDAYSTSCRLDDYRRLSK